MSAILVTMGYWSGDRALALEVTGQIGKLLPEKSDIADLCYIYRHDSQPPDLSALARDREKFGKVYCIPTTYKYEGWPGGCNSIAYTLINTVLQNAEKSVECALLLESDCVITRPEWDKQLLEEWKMTKKEKKVVCGTVLPWSYNKLSHVNASALWGRHIQKHVGGIKSAKPKNIAWDYYFGSNIALVARNSPLFRLDWKRDTITAKELFASPALVYHGVKDRTAFDAVNRKYKL